MSAPPYTLFWLAHELLVQQRRIIPLLEAIRDEADRLLQELQRADDETRNRENRRDA